MKKYRNSILMVTIMLLLAIGAKSYSEKHGYIQLDFSLNVNRSLFYLYLVLSFILILFIGYYGIYILRNAEKIDRENIPEVFEKKLGRLIFINEVWSKSSLLVLAVTLNRKFYLELKGFRNIPTYFLAASIILLLVLIKYSNSLCPHVKINPFENKACEKHFNKLDEGQKWIAYKSSFAVLETMKNVYYILFVGMIFLSVLIDIPLVILLITGSLPIIQAVIYAFESRKIKG